jgi:hypothetical protein
MVEGGHLAAPKRGARGDTTHTRKKSENEKTRKFCERRTQSDGRRSRKTMIFGKTVTDNGDWFRLVKFSKADTIQRQQSSWSEKVRSAEDILRFGNFQYQYFCSLYEKLSTFNAFVAIDSQNKNAFMFVGAGGSMSESGMF